jgi:hypothetical protein
VSHQDILHAAQEHAPTVCCHVRSQAPVAWERALTPYAASQKVSARGRRCGSGPPVHFNRLRCSLSMRSSPMPLLQSPVPLVHPFRKASVSSRATFLSVNLYFGTPYCCMGSVPVLIARFASPGRHQLLLGGRPCNWWNAAGTASSISSTAARLLRLIVRILLKMGTEDTLASEPGLHPSNVCPYIVCTATREFT